MTLQEQKMFGLGWPEILLILGVVIIIFGPKRIPELGGALGKTLRGFKEELQTQDVDSSEVVDVDLEESDSAARKK
ncbi:twin-arginine translocase TatA/TatE family subunit [Synechocystis salina]